MEQSNNHAIAEREVHEIRQASQLNGIPVATLRKVSIPERVDTNQASSILEDVRKSSILGAIHSVKAESEKLNNKTEIVRKSWEVEFDGPVRTRGSFVDESIHDQAALSASLDPAEAVKRLQEQRRTISLSYSGPVVTKRKSDEQGVHRPSPVAPPEQCQAPEMFDIADLRYKRAEGTSQAHC